MTVVPPVEDVPPETTEVAAQCETELSGGAMLDIVHGVIGRANCGFEFLEYAAACAIFLILVSFVASFLINFSKFMGAK